MIKFLTTLCFCILSVRSENHLECPDVQTIKPFNATRYVGKWYELEKYPFIFETFQKCITAEYSLNPNGTVNVKNTGYTVIHGHLYPITINGLATPDPSNPSNLTVSFPGFGSGGKYWVLDTDYTTYSLVYACTYYSHFSIRIENAWIFGRSKQLSSIDSATIVRLKEILSSKGSSTNKFSATTQDCQNN